MTRLIKLAWFFGKTWALTCFLLVMGQLRVAGDTVLNHMKNYFDRPKVAKHFAQILYPVHWTLDKVGFNVGMDKVDRVIAFQQTTEEKIKDTFGEAAAVQMEKYKQAAETQRKALEAIERDLAE